MKLKAPELESKRLLLRPFRTKDAEEFLELEHRKEKINNIQKAKFWIKKSKTKNSYYLAVILKESNKLIGFVELCHLDWFDKAGEIGYTINKKYRNKGFATEASKTMIDYCFKKLKFIKVYADTDPKNLASQKVLKKLGFKLEGRIRKKNFIKGKWTDELDYGLLKEEWKRIK